MSVIRILFIIALAFILQACASPRMSQELEQGKLSFSNGEFKQAFHELLPVANEGHPQAQYAVGYMYYNGYGVPEDTESGIFWMTKSAEQNYKPAQDALRLIRGNNLKAARAQRLFSPKGDAILEVPKRPVEFAPAAPTSQTPPTRKTFLLPYKKTSFQQNISSHDEVMEALNSQRPVKKETMPVTKAPMAKANYTLQLFGSYDLNDVKKLQTKFASQKMTRSWRTEREGKNWYVLTYGEYKNVASAKQSLTNLPNYMRDLQPWVRPIEQLKTVG